MVKAKKFGVFTGVFTPSILTILGVIMYMRLGWVVGQAGLINAIIIILRETRHELCPLALGTQFLVCPTPELGRSLKVLLKESASGYPIMYRFPYFLEM